MTGPHLDALMDRFAQIRGARVGHGPDHPQLPDRSMEPRVDGFLQSYPMLRRDHDYVEFLEKYAGALIDNPDEGQLVDVFGFDQVSTDMLDMEGPVVDENGFLVFAQCIYHVVIDGKLEDMYEYDFAFDVSGERRFGVYCAKSTLRTGNRAFTLYFEGFAAWLRDVVEKKGWYERPALE